MDWEALRRPTAEARVLSSSLPSSDFVVIVNHTVLAAVLAAVLAIPLVSSFSPCCHRMTLELEAICFCSATLRASISLRRRRTLMAFGYLGTWRAAHGL